jgi:hypothetical protein
MVYFFRDVLGVKVIDKALLSQRTEATAIGWSLRAQPQT